MPENTRFTPSLSRFILTRFDFLETNPIDLKEHESYQAILLSKVAEISRQIFGNKTTKLLGSISSPKEYIELLSQLAKQSYLSSYSSPIFDTTAPLSDNINLEFTDTNPLFDPTIPLSLLDPSIIQKYLESLNVDNIGIALIIATLCDNIELAHKILELTITKKFQISIEYLAYSLGVNSTVGKIEMVNIILKYIKDNKLELPREGKHSITKALTTAAMKGELEVVNTILEYIENNCLEISIEGFFSFTHALLCAAYEDHTEVVNRLLEWAKRKDIQLPIAGVDNLGHALNQTIIEGHKKTADLLWQYIKDTKENNSQFLTIKEQNIINTVFFTAIRTDNFEIANEISKYAKEKNINFGFLSLPISIIIKDMIHCIQNDSIDDINFINATMIKYIKYMNLQIPLEGEYSLSNVLVETAKKDLTKILNQILDLPQAKHIPLFGKYSLTKALYLTKNWKIKAKILSFITSKTKEKVKAYYLPITAIVTGILATLSYNYFS